MRRLHIFLAITLLVFFYQLLDSISRVYSQGLVLITLLICFSTSILIVREYKGYVIRPTTVFLVSFLIVNCQLLLDLILGIIDVTNKSFYSSSVINKSAIYNVFAILSFYLGYFLIKHKTTKNRNIYFSPKFLSLVIWIQFFFFLLWLSTIGISDLTGAAYVESIDVEGSSLRDYFADFYQCSLYLNLALLAKKPNNVSDIKDFFNFIPKLILVPSFVYVGIMLLSSDRGAMIYTLSLYTFYYVFLSRKRIKLLIIFPLLFIGAILMTSISLSRGFGDSISFGERISYSLSNKDDLGRLNESVSPFTRELAGSHTFTNVVLETVGEGEMSYEYGLEHFCYALKCLPFIGTIIITDVLGIPQLLQGSANYIRYVYLGPNAAAGAGTGSTLIADFYMDFGFVGVILGFVVMGIMFSWVDYAMIKSSISSLSISKIFILLITFYIAFYLPRATFFLSIFRPFLYSYLLYRVLLIFNYKRR